jgi:hypothetical protein
MSCPLVSSHVGLQARAGRAGAPPRRRPVPPARIGSRASGYLPGNGRAPRLGCAVSLVPAGCHPCAGRVPGGRVHVVPPRRPMTTPRRPGQRVRRRLLPGARSPGTQARHAARRPATGSIRQPSATRAAPKPTIPRAVPCRARRRAYLPWTLGTPSRVKASVPRTEPPVRKLSPEGKGTGRGPHGTVPTPWLPWPDCAGFRGTGPPARPS